MKKIKDTDNGNMGTYINGLATYVIKLELRRELGGGSKGPQYSALQREAVRVSVMSGLRAYIDEGV